jgi:hypothetical protein
MFLPHHFRNRARVHPLQRFESFAGTTEQYTVDDAAGLVLAQCAD